MKPTSAVPHVVHLKLQALGLEDVAGPQRVRVDVVGGVRVEQARLRAVEDGLHAGRIGQAEDAPSTRHQ